VRREERGLPECMKPADVPFKGTLICFSSSLYLWFSVYFSFWLPFFNPLFIAVLFSVLLEYVCRAPGDLKPQPELIGQLEGNPQE